MPNTYHYGSELWNSKNIWLFLEKQDLPKKSLKDLSKKSAREFCALMGEITKDIDSSSKSIYDAAKALKIWKTVH